MKILGALFGFLVLAVVFVIWVRAYKSIKGDDEPLFSMGKRKARKENNSLEDFISAYKRGDVAIGDIAAPAEKSATALPSNLLATPNAVPAQVAPVRREVFLSGASKLAYLACKTGLRDHHVFAHVPLSALSTGGAINPALAGIGVDLLVCNGNLSAVAAIDMIDAGNGEANAAKSDYLKALGIRYLRLSAKSLPRPDELHALLYRM